VKNFGTLLNNHRKLGEILDSFL